MIKSLILLLFILTLNISCLSQNKTDFSLYLKKDRNNYLHEVSSKSGNLFHKLGHHGPAIENLWVGYRIYFNKKTAIDVYSKTRPGLELREKAWYPDKKDQKNGWGADYYRVGKTVGLGGIRLWDGEKVVKLNPVSNREAKVYGNENNSVMELISKGIKYKNKKVDILLRVTVYNDKREATVEIVSLKGDSVQFVTGINYFTNLKIEKTPNFIATWGIHPEDVAAEKVEIGAAIVFSPDDFETSFDDGKQVYLMAKPAPTIKFKITSANAREEKINTFDKFLEEVKSIK